MVRLTGLPRWYIKRQAARLGLTLHMDRRPWTASEMNLLEKSVGRVSSATIAKRLHRPESSVVNKLKRIGTSRRVRNGYTMRDLELCLGEDHHKITQWIKNGWLQDHLQGTRRHDGNGNDIHRIREKDILTFIRNHPQEINLGKVDQTWFLDLVLLRGREVPAAKLPRTVKPQRMTQQRSRSRIPPWLALALSRAALSVSRRSDKRNIRMEFCNATTQKTTSFRARPNSRNARRFSRASEGWTGTG